MIIYNISFKKDGVITCSTVVSSSSEMVLLEKALLNSAISWLLPNTAMNEDELVWVKDSIVLTIDASEIRDFSILDQSLKQSRVTKAIAGYYSGLPGYSVANVQRAILAELK